LLNAAIKYLAGVILAVALLAWAGFRVWTSPAGEEQATAPPTETIDKAAVAATAAAEIRNARLLLARFERENNPEALRAATEHARRALDLEADAAGSLHVNGLVRDARSDYREARDFFARVRDIEPDNALGFTSAASTFVPQGELGLALEWLQRAQSIDPNSLELGGALILINDCLENYAASRQWSEWIDQRITNQPRIMALQARHHYLTGNFETAIQTSNLALQLDLPRDWQADAIFMRIKRDQALAEGTPQQGIELFMARHPDLFEPDPAIRPDNITQAVDLSLLLDFAGREQQSLTLLSAALQAYESRWFTSGSARAGLLPIRAEALALMGRREAALQELERVVNAGWRIYWRWKTELNPNFESIRNQEKFGALTSRLEADMAKQRSQALARLESMMPGQPATDGG
jgi:tetratricopeptide (TPR) repeat protein